MNKDKNKPLTLDQSIAAIGSTLTATRNTITKLGLAVIAHRERHGDCTKATRLLKAIQRSNFTKDEAFKKFLRMGAMSFDKKTKQFKCNRADIDWEALRAYAKVWHTFTAEVTTPTYTFIKAKAAAKSLRTRIIKGLEGDEQTQALALLNEPALLAE